MEAILRAFDAQVEDVKRSTRTVVARICTEDIDRFNSVFVVRGGKLAGYEKNKAVLWEHGKDSRRSRDPIGRNEWIKRDGGPAPKEIIAKTRFLEDDFSNQRYEWYRDGVLNAFSIGAIPNLEACGPATRDEIRANPEYGKGRYVEFGGGPGVFMYRDWELTEYSGTVVAGNPNAIVEERAVKLLACVERGLWIPDDMKADLESKATTERAAAVAKPTERSEPYIDNDDGMWTVFHASGSKCMAFAERSLADECLKLLTASPESKRAYYAAEASQAIAETRRAYGDIRTEIQEYIDLYRYGKV